MYILMKSDNGTITTETFSTIEAAVKALQEDYDSTYKTGEYKKSEAFSTISNRQLISKKGKLVVSWKVEELSENGKMGIGKEDKAKICRLLCKTLQETRFGSDLINIKYVKNNDEEIVELAFLGGVKTVNVALDSGAAMIKDIVNNMGL